MNTASTRQITTYPLCDWNHFDSGKECDCCVDYLHKWRWRISGRISA
jgi:hypothetical protein